jgi:hypothetical protein
MSTTPRRDSTDRELAAITGERVAEAVCEYAARRPKRSNEKLAEVFGVCPRTMASLKKGSSCTLAVARRVAEVTDVSLDWLCGLSEQKYRDQTRTPAALEADLGALVTRSLCGRYEWAVNGQAALAYVCATAMKVADALELVTRKTVVTALTLTAAREKVAEWRQLDRAELQLRPALRFMELVGERNGMHKNHSPSAAGCTDSNPPRR